MTVQELNTVFSHNIKLYRDLKYLSQMELAEKAGVTIHALKTWEGGSRIAHGPNLILLATALGVQVWELFYPGKVVLMGDEKLRGGRDENRTFTRRLRKN